jgi:hypothetical protein
VTLGSFSMDALRAGNNCEIYNYQLHNRTRLLSFAPLSALPVEQSGCPRGLGSLTITAGGLRVG